MLRAAGTPGALPSSFPGTPGWPEPPRGGLREEGRQHPAPSEALEGLLCPGGNLWAPVWPPGCAQPLPRWSFCGLGFQKLSASCCLHCCSSECAAPHPLGGSPKAPWPQPWISSRVADLQCLEREMTVAIVPIPESRLFARPVGSLLSALQKVGPMVSRSQKRKQIKIGGQGVEVACPKHITCEWQSWGTYAHYPGGERSREVEELRALGGSGRWRSGWCSSWGHPKSPQGCQ